MITGFNTDVQHEGRIYHVQTEDRGGENPILESLVYIGGTIIAKKQTPYAEKLSEGASEDMIASLLKKQHQVIIAAIKAGRIEDLIRHSTNEEVEEKVKPVPASRAQARSDRKSTSGSLSKSRPPSGSLSKSRPSSKSGSLSKPGPLSKGLSAPLPVVEQAERPNVSAKLPARPAGQITSERKTGGLNLDEVVLDYLKRTSEQGKLDLKVITPSVFTAGKSIGLRVQVSLGGKPEADAIVTVKVIGTAFKPLVFMGRSGADGTASFNLALPAFTAGTAAIVIEAQSSRGRGELKHLIRRA